MNVGLQELLEGDELTHREDPAAEVAEGDGDTLSQVLEAGKAGLETIKSLTEKPAEKPAEKAAEKPPSPTVTAPQAPAAQGMSGAFVVLGLVAAAGVITAIVLAMKSNRPSEEPKPRRKAA